MKHILSALLIICCINTSTSGQGISFAPSTLIFTAAPGAYAPALSTTISGSGLIPANGSVTVTAPVKFYLDGTADFVTIPYTGGTLPPTTIYVSFAITNSGFGSTGTLTVTGGGAPVPNICMCAFMSTCPCATTNVTEFLIGSSLSIEPNPAHDYLTVTAGDLVRKIIITNIIGQVQFNHEYNSDHVQVNISNLPTGFYLITVNGTDVKKFVKE